jgi:DNA-binding transcriptional regulator YiaG
MAKVDYDAEVRHDGRLHSFTIRALEVPVCQNCGAKVFTETVDDQINSALRSHLNLLTPEEMRAALERVQMTQKEAAERLGIAEATLSRWLTKTQIQSRAMDNLLRVFFAFPEVRNVLNGQSQDPALGGADLLQRNFDSKEINERFVAVSQSLAELKEAVIASRES